MLVLAERPGGERLVRPVDEFEHRGASHDEDRPGGGGQLCRQEGQTDPRWRQLPVGQDEYPAQYRLAGCPFVEQTLAEPIVVERFPDDDRVVLCSITVLGLDELSDKWPVEQRHVETDQIVVQQHLDDGEARAVDLLRGHVDAEQASGVFGLIVEHDLARPTRQLHSTQLAPWHGRSLGPVLQCSRSPSPRIHVVTPARAAPGEPDGQLLRLRSASGRIALAATVLASSAALLDSTVANVALPRIGEEFGGDLGTLQWVITGYLLTLASFILLGGALGDRYGQRRIFRLGAVWFALASLGCALAPSLPLLVAARVVQGVGAALLTPTALALTQSSFVREERGAAVGAWSGLGGVAAAIGPLFGGWMVDGPGWRWAFLLNLPLIAGALLATRSIPETVDETLIGDADGHGTARSFDLVGAVLGAVALGTATWALTQGPERGWSDSLVLGGTVLALVLGAGFVLRQRTAPNPLVPHGLFGSRTFTVLNIATFALYATLSGQFFLLAYQLQVSAGWSALEAGSALLPSTLLMLMLSERSGALAARVGPRAQLIVGPLLIATAQVLLSSVDERTRWATDVLPGALLFGFGLVAFVAPLTASVMASVEPSHVGTASGVNNAIARTAGLTAIAVIPVVSGLSTASGPAETTAAFRVGMLITAGLAAVAAVIAAVGLPRHVATRDSSRKFYCAVDGAPAQVCEETRESG